MIVKIGGNNSGLKETLKDSKNEIKQTFSVNPVNELTSALTGATGKLGGFISKVGAISALTAGGFGLGSLVEKAVQSGESIYQLSTKMGITASEASNLNKILKLTNSDTGSFASAMTRLDKSYSAAGETGEKTRAVLAAFGVSLTDNEGKLLPLNQQLANLSKGYKLAAANGIEQEYIISTLGVKGLALVQTLKDYDEAARTAAQSKGVGIDPEQMHKLDQEMKIVSMQAGALGTAFAGALAPVAEQIFPPLMSGLASTAKLLADNKSEIGNAVTAVLELGVAYKGLTAAGAVVTGIGNAWQATSAQTIAAMTTAGAATGTLTATQEKLIARVVASSNREYAKMETAAIKAATSAAGSSEAAAAVIVEKTAQISLEAAQAAENIRLRMTTAFAAQAEAAVAAGTVTTEALAVQTAAASAAGAKSVVANETVRESAVIAATAQLGVAEAHVAAGNAAVAQGEKTVTAMAVARTAVGNLTSSLWAMAGGWAGVAVATGYAVYQLYNYNETKNRVDSYDENAQVYKDPKTGKYTKKVLKTERNQDTGRMESSWDRVELSSDELKLQKDHEANQLKQALGGADVGDASSELLEKMKAALAGTDKDAIKAAKDAARESGQVVKAEADYEIAVAQKKAELTKAANQDAIDDLERQRKGDLSGIRAYWANYAKEDTAGITAIQEYWKKRTELETQGVQADLDALNQEKDALQNQMNQTSDPSESIELKKRMLDLTTQITLKERELGNVVKKNTDLANDEVAGYIEKYASLVDSTQKAMKSVGEANLSKSKTGSAGDMFNLQKERDASVYAVNDVIKAWGKGTVEIKDKYGRVIDDELKLKEWAAEQGALIDENYNNEVTKYRATCKDIQADIDAAYNANSMTMLQKALSQENLIRQSNYEAQKQMMDLYLQASQDSILTSSEFMARASASAYDGLKDGIADVLTGTKSIGDAWTALGDTVKNVIAKMVAEWLAGRLAMALMGKKSEDQQVSKSAAQGAATAAAWTPAAVMVSLATFGENAGPAISGMTMATLAGMALGSVSGYAEGGLIRGPGTGKSDSILARVANKEYILTAAATSFWGVKNLDAMNQGKMPAFSTGGLVTGASLSSVSGRYSSASIGGKQMNEEYGGSNTEQPVQESHIHLHTIDGASTETWLENGGGKKIMRFLNKQVRFS